MPSTSPGLKIASVRGVPIYVARTWALVAVLIIATFGPQVSSARPSWGLGAYLIAACYTLLLLISVIAHELAHTLAALSRGYHVDRIVADLWGGHTSYDAREATPGHLAFISAVGPAANFALGALGWLVLHEVNLPEAAYLLMWAFTWSNTFVGIFNSLPGIPLDGGFIVDALVWKVTGNRATGMRAAGWCGRIVAVLVIAWAAWPVLTGDGSGFSLIWMLLIASFLWRGASTAVAVGGNRQVLSGISLGSLIRPAVALPADLPIDEAPETGQLLVLLDATGRPTATVTPGAHVRVPIEQRGTVPLSALAHVLPEGSAIDVPSLDADITEVLPAFATDPPAPLVILVQRAHAGEPEGPGKQHHPSMEEPTSTPREREKAPMNLLGVITFTDVERALQQQAHRLHSTP